MYDYVFCILYDIVLFCMQLLCADVSPSGGLGVCSSEDGKLWVWETDTGEARVSIKTITKVQKCVNERIGECPVV